MEEGLKFGPSRIRSCLESKCVFPRKYLINTKGLLSKEGSSAKKILRDKPMELGVTFSVMAEEISVMYRKMAERQESPRKAGLLRLVSEVLEDLAVEAIKGSISEATLERLMVLGKILRMSGLPSVRIERLVRSVKRYMVPAVENYVNYVPPQLETSNSILS